MHQEELSLLRAGDLIDYRTKQRTPRGLIDAGIQRAQVVGVTGNSALIKSRSHPLLTLAVQAKDIVAAYRVQRSGVTLLYEEEQSPAGET
jgi:hypothetical protein